MPVIFGDNIRAFNTYVTNMMNLGNIMLHEIARYKGQILDDSAYILYLE